MRFELVFAPKKKYRGFFLFYRRYCEECKIGFQFEVVPSQEDDHWPACPICGRALYSLFISKNLRSKRRIR